MSQLSEACDDLTAWLPRAAELIHQPDTDGTTSGGKPRSMPPGNPAAIAVFYDAHAMIRDTLALFQFLVTGSVGQPISWSDASTYKALQVIEKLGDAVPTLQARRSARDLGRCVTAIRQLPAIDEVEHSRRFTGAECPYCGFAMLQVYPRSGSVACLRFGVCFDADGNHPSGQVSTNEVDGSPCIAWSDGLVT